MKGLRLVPRSPAGTSGLVPQFLLDISHICCWGFLHFFMVFKTFWHFTSFFFGYLEPIFWDNHPHACFIFPGPKEPLTQAVFTPLMVTMPRSTLTPAWCAKRKRLKLRPILRKGGEGSETSRLIVWSREGAWVLGGCVFFFSNFHK